MKALDPAGVADNRAPTGVKRVLVQYDETPSVLNTSHSWRPIELHQDTDGTWVGALVTSHTDGRYFIQAVDGAGNTGVSQFKGNYYQANGTSPQAVAVVTNGTLGASNWYVSPVQVSLYVAGVLASSANGYTYSFDGISQGLYSAPFDVPQGTTSITFAPPASSTAPAPPALVVRKDTLAPTATLAPALSVIAAGSPVPTPTCTAARPGTRFRRNRLYTAASDQRHGRGHRLFTRQCDRHRCGRQHVTRGSANRRDRLGYEEP